MISAVEARAKVESLEHPKTKDILLRIERHIYKAIEEGRLNTQRLYWAEILNSPVFNIVETHLLENGYSITSCKKDGYFQIHW